MTLLRRMLKEEWRTHSRLFGSYGFAAFPLLIVLMTGVSYPVLVLAGFTLPDIVLGLHLLVLFFGLHVGTIGFISHDALKNLLGEQNLLIFSSRTLPLSRRRILSVFLVKDLLYYAFLLIIPLIISLLPAYLYFQEPLARLLLVWATASGTFMLGVAISFLLVTIYMRSRLVAVGLGISGLLVTAAVPSTVLQVTPLALLRMPQVQTVVTGFLLIPVFIGMGLVLSTTNQRHRHRTKRNMYATIAGSRSFPDTAVSAKSVLDVLRSSGSLFKILFSQGIVFGVFAYFLLHIPFLTGLQSRAVIALAIVLGLGSLTTYSWVSRFDRTKQYLTLPLSGEAVFRGKLSTFYLLALPTGYLYLLVAGSVFGTDQLLLSGIVFPLVATYLFGMTAYIAGFDPDTLLFDAKRFAMFTVLTGIVLIPLFISLLLVQHQVALYVLLIGISGLAAAAGHTLYEVAAHRWPQQQY